MVENAIQNYSYAVLFTFLYKIYKIVFITQ